MTGDECLQAVDFTGNDKLKGCRTGTLEGLGGCEGVGSLDFNLFGSSE